MWLRQAGPVWVTSHGLTLAQYNAQRTTWENAGYRPKIVTASGSGADKVFAAVYVQDGVAAAHSTEQGLSTFRADVEAKLAAGLRLVSCATYGSTSVPLSNKYLIPSPRPPT